jgi:hypothetical protein
MYSTLFGFLRPRGPSDLNLGTVGMARAVPDTISARFGNIGNRIGKAETLPIFADIVTAKLKPYRYDIGKYRTVTDIRTDILLL